MDGIIIVFQGSCIIGYLCRIIELVPAEASKQPNVKLRLLVFIKNKHVSYVWANTSYFFLTSKLLKILLCS